MTSPPRGPHIPPFNFHTKFQHHKERDLPRTVSIWRVFFSFLEIHDADCVKCRNHPRHYGFAKRSYFFSFIFLVLNKYLAAQARKLTFHMLSLYAPLYLHLPYYQDTYSLLSVYIRQKDSQNNFSTFNNLIIYWTINKLLMFCQDN